ARKRGSPGCLEEAAAGLALGAVVDRVLLEVDAGDRSAAGVTGLAELVVDAADLRVLRAALAQFEAPRELGVDRIRERLDVSRGQSLGRGERGQLRRVQDLVRPRAADAGDHPLVAEQGVQPPRLV